MRHRGMLAVVATLILLQLPATPGGAGAPTLTTDRFGNGSAGAVLEFQAPGDNLDLNLSLQTGLLVRSASLSVEGRPLPGNASAYPADVVVDAGNDGDPEWAFTGTGYGALGRQTMVSTGETRANVTFPAGGGTNGTVSLLLPKNAVVVSADINITNQRGSGAGTRVAIEARNGNLARDVVNNDPVYSMDALLKGQGMATKIVDGTEIDTQAELANYDVVVTGDSGSNDDDFAVYQTALKNWVNGGGGFVGTGWIVYSLVGGSDMDQVVPASPGYTWVGGGNNVRITDNAHPVTLGVNNFPVQQYGEYPASGTVDAGASRLGDYGNNNQPAIVVKDLGQGRTVYLGPVLFGNFQSYNVAPYYNDNSAKRLITNAVIWAANNRPLNISLDIGGDGTAEWQNTNFTGSARPAGLASALNAYLTCATAAPDPYGNRMVSVPLSLKSATEGGVTLGNISIVYNATFTVGPKTGGNLTTALNDLLPDSQGTDIVSIPLRVSSSAPGTVSLGNISIVSEPPAHTPTIVSFPPDPSFTMDENSSRNLSVAGSDIYGNPLAYRWYLDGAEAKGLARPDYTYAAGFESAGKHNITVVADNGQGQTQFSWSVTVRNIDRPPAITAITPAGDPSVDENRTIGFTVTASDPDRDALNYTWTLDGVKVGKSLPSWNYTPSFTAAGKHDVKVSVSDPYTQSALAAWKVTVLNVNRPPVFTFTDPPVEEATLDEGLSIRFTVSANDPDGDAVTYSWIQNDAPAGKGTLLDLATNFTSAGNYSVKVDASDGSLNASRLWLVRVNDVNRAPEVRIASPAEGDEFNEGDSVRLSALGTGDPDGDPLTLAWSDEKGTVLARAVEANATLPPGDHTLTLEASDGRGLKNRTFVTVRVNPLSLALSVALDPPEPKAGAAVKVAVTLRNRGGGTASGVRVEFSVDGGEPQVESVDIIKAGGTRTVTFTWKADAGTHMLKVKAGGEAWDRSIKVSKANAAATGGGWEWLWVLVVLAVIVPVVAVAASMVRRRSRRPAGALPPPAPPAQFRYQYPSYYQQAPQSPAYYAPATPPPPPPAAYNQPQAQPYYAPPLPAGPAPALPYSPSQPPVTAPGSPYDERLDALRSRADTGGAAGTDVEEERNMLRLASAYLRAGNPARADLYMQRVEAGLVKKAL